MTHERTLQVESLSVLTQQHYVLFQVIQAAVLMASDPLLMVNKNQKWSTCIKAIMCSNMFICKYVQNCLGIIFHLPSKMFSNATKNNVKLLRSVYKWTYFWQIRHPLIIMWCGTSLGTKAGWLTLHRGSETDNFDFGMNRLFLANYIFCLPGARGLCSCSWNAAKFHEPHLTSTSGLGPAYIGFQYGISFRTTTWCIAKKHRCIL